MINDGVREIFLVNKNKSGTEIIAIKNHCKRKIYRYDFRKKYFHHETRNAA
jgi:hypothetical protein